MRQFSCGDGGVVVRGTNPLPASRLAVLRVSFLERIQALPLKNFFMQLSHPPHLAATPPPPGLIIFGFQLWQ